MMRWLGTRLFPEALDEKLGHEKFALLSTSELCALDIEIRGVGVCDRAVEGLLPALRAVVPLLFVSTSLSLLLRLIPSSEPSMVSVGLVAILTLDSVFSKYCFVGFILLFGRLLEGVTATEGALE